LSAKTIYTIFQQVANMDDAWKVNPGAMSAEHVIVSKTEGAKWHK
jgi:hypothetical protein